MTKRDRDKTDTSAKSKRVKIKKLYGSTSETVNYVTHISWRKDRRELGIKLKGRTVSGAREHVHS